MTHLICQLFGHKKTLVPLSSNRYYCRRCGFDFGVDGEPGPSPTIPPNTTDDRETRCRAPAPPLSANANDGPRCGCTIAPQHRRYQRRPSQLPFCSVSKRYTRQYCIGMYEGAAHEGSKGGKAGVGAPNRSGSVRPRQNAKSRGISQCGRCPSPRALQQAADVAAHFRTGTARLHSVLDQLPVLRNPRRGFCVHKKPRWRDGHHRGGAPHLAVGKGN
jgi:hypothetical protein